MNILERLKHHRNDGIYIGHRTRPGWYGPLPFYRFWCPKHGFVENYPQSHYQILYCPECQDEHLAKQRRRQRSTA